MTALSDAKKALKAAQAEVERLEAEANRAKYSTLGGLHLMVEEIIKGDSAAARLPLWSQGRWLGAMHSWRGMYQFPAIGVGWDSAWTAIGLRNELKEALAGKVYEGYKGGDYTYKESDPIYVSDREGGEGGSFRPAGYRVLDDRVEILTWNEDAE